MLYYCRVTEIIEREVVVDAPGPRMARYAASQKQHWLDTGAGTTVGIEVEHIQPHESEGDAMQAWKERVE